jgi:predicted enzyme related to lactoylglutathione lyase
MAHPVMKFQILSADPDGTARFYSDLFKWTVNADNPLGYREICTGSPEGIDGGIWPAPQQAQNFVQLFVYADDVRGVVERAQGLGAKLVIPPTVLPQGEEMAVMVDPKGMTFGIWRPAQT